MKKCARFWGLCLLWALLLGVLPWAGAYSGKIEMERDIEPTSREDGRTFTLRTRVWDEDPLGLREPCRVLFADGRDGDLSVTLGRLARTAEKEGAPVCLVILAGESEPPSGEEGLSMRQSVQRVRDLGGQSFVCGKAGWEFAASAPVEGHFFLPEEEESCREAARRYAVGAYDVEVREVLDPRFTISQKERGRLKKEGARVRLVGKSWVVAWTAELPRSREDPWIREWTVEAKAAFPGGNGVPISGEGAGVFLEGKSVAGAEEGKVNVGVNLRLRDIDEKIFLGETVPTAWGDGSVEDKMLGFRPDWFGKGVTGTFSFQWEGVGTLEQLGRVKPKESVDYSLRVVFTPKGSGKGAAGMPVEQTAALGRYRVQVMPGVLRIQVEGDGAGRWDSLALRVEGKGESRTVLARPEADPQSGVRVLAAVVDDLPYGKYTVTPGVTMDGKKLETQECLLGVCREDDTVEVSRRFATARFQLE